MSIEAMKQALEFFDNLAAVRVLGAADEPIRTALRQAIEQAEKQKPVAVILEDMKGGGYIEWLDDTYFVPGTKFYTQPQQAEKQEQVALKNGECWPEYVMEEWDYWRKQIADGDKSSAPRDWFEELAELKLATAQPQREWVGLTDEEIDKTHETQVWDARRSYARAIEAKLKEKNS